MATVRFDTTKKRNNHLPHKKYTWTSSKYSRTNIQTDKHISIIITTIQITPRDHTNNTRDMWSDQNNWHRNLHRTDATGKDYHP